MNNDIERLLGSNYAAWKTWGSTGQYQVYSKIFSQELKRSGTRRDAHILEIGFGPGLFLDWAKANGYTVTGIEINREQVDASKERGHDAHHGEVADIFGAQSDCFDLIVLFDVLEHIPLDGLFDLFAEFDRLLTDGGKVLARFPNGGSPFGRLYQYGDATHRTVLTSSLIEQIAMTRGLDLLSSHNAARWKINSKSGGLKNSLIIQGVAYLMRDIIQIPLSLIYYGKIVPMDANMTVVLEKQNATNSAAGF